MHYASEQAMNWSDNSGRRPCRRSRGSNLDYSFEVLASDVELIISFKLLAAQENNH